MLGVELWAEIRHPEHKQFSVAEMLGGLLSLAQALELLVLWMQGLKINIRLGRIGDLAAQERNGRGHIAFQFHAGAAALPVPKASTAPAISTRC